MPCLYWNCIYLGFVQASRLLFIVHISDSRHFHNFKSGLGLEGVHPASWGQLGSYLIEIFFEPTTSPLRVTTGLSILPGPSQCPYIKSLFLYKSFETVYGWEVADLIKKVNINRPVGAHCWSPYPGYCHPLVGCRSLVDRCGSLGSCHRLNFLNLISNNKMGNYHRPTCCYWSRLIQNIWN